MKFSLILFLVVLISCKEITYKEPQPKGKKSLTEIPFSLQGKYLLIDENGIDKDTLYINRSGYRTQGGAVEEGVLVIQI